MNSVTTSAKRTKRSRKQTPNHKKRKNRAPSTPNSNPLHMHKTGNTNSKPSDLELLHAADSIGIACRRRKRGEWANGWDDSHLTFWMVDKLLLLERHDRIESSWCDFRVLQAEKSIIREATKGFFFFQEREEEENPMRENRDERDDDGFARPLLQ